MRLFVSVAMLALVSLTSAYPRARPQQHQPVDPAYLRQYYAQIAQQGGQRPAATPIFEQGAQESAQPQYQQQGPLKNFPRPQQQTQAYQAAPQQVRYSQPQAQQIQYAPQPQPQQQQQQQYQQKPQPKRPQNGFKQQLEEDDPEQYDTNPSYNFGFDVKDDENTNYQNRKESREGNVIKGSYSVVDSDGFIRTVTYTADPKEGFKAEVVREPTDIVIKMPKPNPEYQAQQNLRTQPQQPKQQFQQQQPAQQYRQQQRQQEARQQEYQQYEQ